MKKEIFTLLTGSIFSGFLSAATITGGTFDTADYGSFLNANISSSTASNKPADRPVSYLFNGVVEGGDNVSSVIFTDVGEGNTVFVNFNTASAVSIDTIKLALRIDGSSANPGTDKRSASSWTLFANSTGGTFEAGDNISSGTINPRYEDTYGDNAIVVTDTFSSVTAQYFRLELTEGGGNGIRAVELAAIPEVANMGYFMGVTLLGLTLFRRRR